MRYDKSFAVTVALLFVFTLATLLPGPPARAGEPTNKVEWMLRWEEEHLVAWQDTELSRVLDYYLNDFQFSSACALARFDLAEPAVPAAGGAVVVRTRVERLGGQHGYSVVVKAPEGVRVVGITPLARATQAGEIKAGKLDYLIVADYQTPPEQMCSEIPPGGQPTLAEGCWAAEFPAVGSYEFDVAIYKDGKEVKRQAVTVLVEKTEKPVRWKAEHEWYPQALTLRARLPKGIEASGLQVALSSSGGLEWGAKGTLALPPDGSPVQIGIKEVGVPIGRLEARITGEVRGARDGPVPTLYRLTDGLMPWGRITLERERAGGDEAKPVSLITTASPAAQTPAAGGGISPWWLVPAALGAGGLGWALGRRRS
ncbi:MAG: hypothetical protein ACPLRW_11570 [Moorellales bacterium]